MTKTRELHAIASDMKKLAIEYVEKCQEDISSGVSGIVVVHHENLDFYIKVLD